MELQNESYFKPKYIMVVGLTMIGSYTTYKLFILAKQCYHYYKIIANLKTNKNTAQVFDHYIEIPYTYLNTNYIVRLPYNQRLAAQMSQIDVKAKWEDQEFDLNQQSGIPLMICANDLGVDSIVCYNNMTDEEDVYVQNHWPYYFGLE